MITIVPDLRMIAQAPFSCAWQYIEPDQSPIDLSAWGAVCTFLRRSDTVLTVPLSTDDGGNIILTLTEQQVAQVIGPHMAYRITLTPIDPQLIEVWVGGVLVE